MSNNDGSLDSYNGSSRTIRVTATLQSDNSKTGTANVQFGTALPNDIIALSANRMSWSNAGSYCAAQGGRLPLINGTTAPVSSVPANTPIDGFGHRGIAWPAELPGGGTNSYWTGTPSSNDPMNFSWHVYETSSVDVTTSSKTALGRRVVCVP